MKAAVKTMLAKTALRWATPSLLAASNPFTRLMGGAVKLQLGRISDDEFRVSLDRFYAGIDRERFAKQIELDQKIGKLDRPGGYKVGINRLACDDPLPPLRVDLRAVWRRKLSLLNRIGFRTDVLILREGESVPPHGHYRVVSGFYLLQGRVAVRHYDRVREMGAYVAVRSSLAKVLGPGEYTTNSEYFQNVHWLIGLAPKSYLFRVTVAGTPTSAFAGHDDGDERVYLDPTGAVDSQGLIIAPYISAERAHELVFPNVEESATKAGLGSVDVLQKRA